MASLKTEDGQQVLLWLETSSHEDLIMAVLKQVLFKDTGFSKQLFDVILYKEKTYFSC